MNEVDERLEVPNPEAPPPELTSGLSQELTSEMNSQSPLELSQIPAAVVATPSWLRLAYAFEFLIALMAIFGLWSEIGGEGHLGLMPWYVKLVCIVGLAWCWVRFTASIVEQQEFWTPRTKGWVVATVLISVIMGAITYYYHLHEEPDEGDGDTTAGAVSTTGSEGFFYQASNATHQ
jgi:hypothetical protein